ncbi:LLM class flavin-dependent oxidoreductase [Streptomyces sp. NPDC058662]|uniref:LLM class flavin-dependent oxidoreductase n=1 Tax=Streptomyces sp. NPDC058662 TaxID=3346583 RepID=UPI0036470100
MSDSGDANRHHDGSDGGTGGTGGRDGGPAAGPGAPTSPGGGNGIRGAVLGRAPAVLSVLDLVTVGSGNTASDALATSVAIARLAEARGFHRHWVAEHHSMPAVVSSSPAVILAYLAAHTSRIRLGSGGVMLPNHAPLVVAEQFGILEAAAPGRVDLGLGRAPGTDGRTAAALRGPGRLDEGADDFPRRLAELTAFLDDDFPDGHPYARVHAVPGPVQGPTARPSLWLLGSSGYSAQMAGELGLPFAYAHHFSAAGTVPALDLYRRSFRPSAVLDAPYSIIGVAAVAADTHEEARTQVLTGALYMMMVQTGRAGLVPTPAEARAFPFSGPGQREFVESRLADTVYGTPDEVTKGLDALAGLTGADELMLTANIHGNAARLRSYELVADAYGLPGPAPAAG